jgi:hypothetical protein
LESLAPELGHGHSSNPLTRGLSTGVISCG